MEPQKNNTLPCPPSEHNAQAPQVSTVPVARKSVFPKGREETRYGYRRASVCKRRCMIIASLYLDNVTLGCVMGLHVAPHTAPGRTRPIAQRCAHQCRRL